MTDDDELYEDGDWGLCSRCGKKLKKYEDVEGLCGSCEYDVWHAEQDEEYKDG